MNYFVYNGVSSLDMGLRIESKNVFSAPEYDVTFQSIPGRNGDLILPNGRYPNVQVTYSVFLPAKSIAELAEKITKVKEAWLYGEQNAYHTLSDSYDTLYTRKGGVFREPGHRGSAQPHRCVHRQLLLPALPLQCGGALSPSPSHSPAPR